jgi:hypothetical protein
MGKIYQHNGNHMDMGIEPNTGTPCRSCIECVSDNGVCWAKAGMYKLSLISREQISRFRRQLHTEGPQMLSATVQTSVARATWRPGFVHIWGNVLFVFGKHPVQITIQLTIWQRSDKNCEDSLTMARVLCRNMFQN